MSGGRTERHLGHRSLKSFSLSRREGEGGLSIKKSTHTHNIKNGKRTKQQQQKNKCLVCGQFSTGVGKVSSLLYPSE